MTADVASDVAITTGLRLSTATVRLARTRAPTIRRLHLEAAAAVAQVVVVAPLAEVVAVDAQLLAGVHLADEGKWCLRFIVYSLRFTVYSLRFTVYGLQFIVYSL